MIHEDDRTEEQKETHRWFVVARDGFLSEWGTASAGGSHAAWACETLTDAKIVEAWVRARPEMKYVHVVYAKGYRPPRSCAHFQVYAATSGSHPALVKS